MIQESMINKNWILLAMLMMKYEAILRELTFKLTFAEMYRS